MGDVKLGFLVGVENDAQRPPVARAARQVSEIVRARVSLGFACVSGMVVLVYYAFLDVAPLRKRWKKQRKSKKAHLIATYLRTPTFSKSIFFVTIQ